MDITNPFGGRIPPNFGEYGRTPSDSTEATPAPPGGAALQGRRAWYRVAYSAMPVPGLPEELRIGGAVIVQTPGPIQTQRTDILQRPGWRPHYDKTMHHGWLEVGQGLHLTVCAIEVTIPGGHIAVSFDVWHNQARAAVGILATFLDERIAQEELLEDLTVMSVDGSTPEILLDRRRFIRDFPPKKAILAAHRTELARLVDVDLEAEDPRLTACRYYLQGAQAGSSVDGVISYVIAIEALVPGEFDPRRIASAIRDAGYDPDALDPSLRQLGRLRGDILHQGLEQHRLLSPGYYALEQIVRLLLRHRLNMGTNIWPLLPDDDNLIRPLRGIANRLRQIPKTTMRRLEGGPPISKLPQGIDPPPEER
jgi:hypothetical protein